MATPHDPKAQQRTSKFGEFLERHPALQWAFALAILLPFFVFIEWLRINWNSADPRVQLIGYAVVCPLVVQDLVRLWRKDWSQRSAFYDFEVRRVWIDLAIAFFLFVRGLIAVVAGSLQERILGAAVSFVIGFGYFKLRAIERRKQRMQPSPFFFWL
jgi:hypothetical protein